MQEKDYKPYFHAVLAIHATLMVLIWLLIMTVLLPAYHKNIKTNEDFVYEFNTTVGQDLYQRNINTIKSIAPGYNLTAKEYATVWQFADKYDISKFPEYVGSSLEQTKASQDLMAQINAASEYLKHNAMNPATASTRLNQAFAINTNNVVNILQSNRKGRYRMPLKAIDNTSEPMPDSVFLYEFNQFFGPEPYKTSVLEIQAIAPRYKFKPEEWAILWTFADRYNIAKFPTYTGDISEQQAASQNFLAQILTAHEYIRNNDMDKETVSGLLNKTFAMNSTDIMNTLKGES